MKKSLLILLAVVGFLAWSCSKTDSLNTNLKQSISTGVSNINSAVGAISTTKGFEILSANTVALKSEITYTDSITLQSVAGVYDFKPDLLHFDDFFIPHRLFVKTGPSDLMIVNLPSKLVFHPRYLHELEGPDSLLKNNFTIKASDYYYYFNWLNKFNYRLKAGLSLDSANAGDMDIMASIDPTSGVSYSSKYNFTNDYSIQVSKTANDSIVSMFSLTKGEDVLMKETVITTRPMMGEDMGHESGEEFHHRERLYILDIGNVEIRRGSGLDSIQVYVSGVLQKHAGAKIIDSTGTDGSVCHRRDILITFDDGTTTNLSTLIDPAKQALKTLVDALHSMNFSRNIVDYIAIGIDYHERHHH